MKVPSRPTRAASALEQALSDQLGGDAAQHLAAAQARIAWGEVLLDEFGHVQPTPGSALVSLARGVARIEAPDSMLAQELTLRRERLLRGLNRRLHERPGGGPPIVELRVAVARRPR